MRARATGSISEIGLTEDAHHVARPRVLLHIRIRVRSGRRRLVREERTRDAVRRRAVRARLRQSLAREVRVEERLHFHGHVVRESVEEKLGV